MTILELLLSLDADLEGAYTAAQKGEWEKGLALIDEMREKKTARAIIFPENQDDENTEALRGRIAMDFIELLGASPRTVNEAEYNEGWRKGKPLRPRATGKDMEYVRDLVQTIEDAGTPTHFRPKPRKGV